jgi:hypothetical protein
MATFPTVPAEDPDQSQLGYTSEASPYSALWWTSQTITDIPSDSVGWLVAQGWQITDITYDSSTIPPTPSYTMDRQSLQNWLILQSLLNSYTIARNDAKFYNSVRYNEVVADWTEMLSSSQEQFTAQTSQHNAHAALYLGDLTTYMNELDTLIDANTTILDAAIASSTSFLNDMQTEHDSFDADFSTVVNLLATDYASHVTTATAFLTDLGTTELARINEKFAASLSTQTTQLMDRGLYSSAVGSDITARSNRDRDEEIAALNDRLNREKFENQHKLYEQQVNMRGQTMAGKDRVNTLAQEVLRYRQAQTMQNAEAETSHRFKVIAEMMSIRMARLQGLQGQHSDGMKLMAYQLDERNKLLVGLYGFVERREDTGPQMEDLTKIATSLGDAGGGWISP